MKANNQDLQKFGLVMGICVAGLFGLFLPWAFHSSYSLIPWLIALIFVMLALIVPQALKIIYIPWIALGRVLGIVNSKIILVILFFFVITPIAIIMKIFKNDPMRRAFDKNKKTYRIIRNEKIHDTSIKNPF